MSQHWDLSTSDARRVFLEVVVGMVMAGKAPVVEFVDDDGARTKLQNSAMHLWFEMCAQTFNDAGIDLRHAIREEVELPVTQNSFKEYIWRPLQKVLTGEHSTTKPSRKDYPLISETIIRHYAQKHGLTLPAWPDRHGGEL